MIKDELFKLYEKLYFYEIDIREKFNSRLQLPLAILVAQISFLGYMLRNAGFSEPTFLLTAFWLLYFGSCVSTSFAIFHFVRSWYGYTFSFIPAAKKTEEYHQKLIKLYKEYDNSEELVKNGIDQYLYKYYQECSSVNTDNNDNKSLKLHKSMSWVIAAILLSFFAFIPYHFGGIDKSTQVNKKSSTPSAQTTHQGQITRDGIYQPEPVSVQQNTKEDKMSEKKQPPPLPPPPPPKRMIKEGVKVVTPPEKGGKSEKINDGGQDG